MAPLTQGALAALIDHTLLKPETTRAEIERHCLEAKAHGFASVCVPPFRVAQAAELLRDTSVALGTVVGFPLGYARSEIKAMETVRAVADGATELDMVLNIGAVKDQNWATVENDIRAVVKAAQGRLVKVILETGLLVESEIRQCCDLVIQAGAQFVKTSTGFSGQGATVESVRLMRAQVGPSFGVKASGGIRDRATLIAMVEAGATRIGTSAGVAILRERPSGESDKGWNY